MRPSRRFALRSKPETMTKPGFMSKTCGSGFEWVASNPSGRLASGRFSSRRKRGFDRYASGPVALTECDRAGDVTPIGEQHENTKQ
jgi:hypothetical protein